MDYKKYALEQLENWVYDCISNDASPQEFYDTIKDAVEEQYHYHKNQTDHCHEILTFLNGEPPVKKNDKSKKWILPVDEVQNAETGEDECFVTFPDDLLEAADLKEGDQVEWIDNDDGSFKMLKVNGTN